VHDRVRVQRRSTGCLFPRDVRAPAMGTEGSGREVRTPTRATTLDEEYATRGTFPIWFRRVVGRREIEASHWWGRPVAGVRAPRERKGSPTVRGVARQPNGAFVVRPSSRA
jgi:hypothetical protein